MKREGSLTYLILIIGCIFFRNEGHRHPRNKVGSQSQAKCISGIQIGNLSIRKLTCYLSHFTSPLCFKCARQLIATKRSIKVLKFTLREKCPYSELFCRHFPAFGLNTERYRVSVRFQSGCGKMRARITPNMDTFYSVLVMVYQCDL